jgi:hypothetical protein
MATIQALINGIIMPMVLGVTSRLSQQRMQVAVKSSTIAVLQARQNFTAMGRSLVIL